MPKIRYYNPDVDLVSDSVLNEDQLWESSLSDFMERGPLIYFFDPVEFAYEEAMDDYAKHTTHGGTWICDGTDPCANGSEPCDHPNHN